MRLRESGGGGKGRMANSLLCGLWGGTEWGVGIAYRHRRAHPLKDSRPLCFFSARLKADQKIQFLFSVRLRTLKAWQDSRTKASSR